MRVFDTGQGRKTDPVDAHSVAVAGLRSSALRRGQIDDATVALRLLVDRRDELGRTRTEIVNRIHQLLLELIPGGQEIPVSRAGQLPAGHCAGPGGHRRPDPPPPRR
ncbi:MAG: transposase [Catenulispora sp.]